MVAAFEAALAGADVKDAGGTGPHRQHVHGIVGDDAHVHHGDAVFVENPQLGEAVDDKHPRNSIMRVFRNSWLTLGQNTAEYRLFSPTRAVQMHGERKSLKVSECCHIFGSDEFIFIYF